MNIFLHYLDLCADLKIPCVLIALIWVSSSISEVCSYLWISEIKWSGTCPCPYLLQQAHPSCLQIELWRIQWPAGNIVSSVWSQQLTALEVLWDSSKSVELPWRGGHLQRRKWENLSSIPLLSLSVFLTCWTKKFLLYLKFSPALSFLKKISTGKKGL